ncbi:MAG: metalloregulator ArsR/SmtB family transcription factor [Alphaproteobacteria bacterium]|nr:metalloregulator ArsR/SmtB family transcription factor [Alphaproteobacteria bacterium]
MKKFDLPHNHGKNKNTENVHTQLCAVADFKVVSDMFWNLGDMTRLRIFWLLCHREECVINIAAIMNMSSPAIAHHLRFLKRSNLIISRRDGKETYYQAAKTSQVKLLHKTIERVMAISCIK